MTVSDALRQALKDTKHTQTWLANKMGYCTPSGIANIVYRGDIRVSILCEICDILDYEVTIQPKQRTGNRREGQIVLEVEE